MKLNKRGFSNVEFVISFALFVMFVFFVFILLNPFRDYSVNNINMDLIQEKLINNVSVELKKISIQVKPDAYVSGHGHGGGGGGGHTSDCIKFSYDDLDAEDNVIARKSDGTVVSSELDHSNNKIIIADDEQFYYIYASSNFAAPSSSLSCSNNIDKTEGLYSLGLYEEDKIISYGILTEIANKYESNYNGLRGDLDITDDFGFVIYSSDGEEMVRALKSAPTRFQVSAKNIPTTIMYENGTFEEVLMNLRIW